MSIRRRLEIVEVVAVRQSLELVVVPAVVLEADSRRQPGARVELRLALVVAAVAVSRPIVEGSCCTTRVKWDASSSIDSTCAEITRMLSTASS